VSFIRYTWLTDNGLPIPAPKNPFHRETDEPNLGMRLDTLRKMTAEDLKKIESLLEQLTGRRLPEKRWRPGLEAPNIYLALARLDRSAVGDEWWEADKIVGMGSLLLIDQLTGRRARIEDVVVDESVRGRGVAKELMRRLHALAYDFGCLHLDLTSAPNRETANALYLNLGYELRETNVYRLKL